MNRPLALAVLLAMLTFGPLIATSMFAAVPSRADREAILGVIREAHTFADKMYNQTNRHYRRGTLAASRAALITAGKADMQRIFTGELATRLTKTWVEDPAQVENVATGPDQIDYGVSRLDVKDLKLTGHKAEVTADVNKYLVDRVHRNGQPYLDRMEGKSTTQVALVKVHGVWKIASLEFKPDLGR